MMLEITEEKAHEAASKCDKLRKEFEKLWPDTFPKENRLTEAQRNNLREAADLIDKSMCWIETKEGHGYWLGIHDRLYEMSYGKPLK